MRTDHYSTESSTSASLLQSNSLTSLVLSITLPWCLRTCFWTGYPWFDSILLLMLSTESSGATFSEMDCSCGLVKTIFMGMSSMDWFRAASWDGDLSIVEMYTGDFFYSTAVDEVFCFMLWVTRFWLACSRPASSKNASL